MLLTGTRHRLNALSKGTSDANVIRRLLSSQQGTSSSESTKFHCNSTKFHCKHAVGHRKCAKSKDGSSPSSSDNDSSMDTSSTDGGGRSETLLTAAKQPKRRPLGFNRIPAFALYCKERRTSFTRAINEWECVVAKEEKEKYSKLSDDSDHQRHRLYRAVPLPIRQLLETNMSAGKGNDWEVIALRVAEILPGISSGARKAWIRIISSCEISRAGEKRFASNPCDEERSSHGFAELVSSWQMPSIYNDGVPWILQRSLRGIDVRIAGDKGASNLQQETGLRPLSTRLDQLVVCQPLGMPPTFSSSSLDEDVHSIESYVYEPEKVQGYLSAMDERLKAASVLPTAVAKCEHAEDEFDPDLPQFDKPAGNGRQKAEGGKRVKKKNDDDT